MSNNEIPVSLTISQNLGPSAAVILGLVQTAARNNADGECLMTHQEIAVRTGIHKLTVKRYLDVLVFAGHLEDFGKYRSKIKPLSEPVREES